MKLPEGASCALWLRLHEEQTGKNTTKPWTVRSAYLAQLLALEQTAGTLAGEFSDAGGVVKYRERDLVDKLVQAYFDSFNLQPSSSGGPFMLVLGELQEYMRTLLGENNLTMGRDIVRASIKWHKQREAQLAGMYEFPEKQDR